MTVNKLIKQEVIECAAYFVEMEITDARRVTVNFKPQKAEANLNATIQQEIAEATRIPDLPPTLFSIKCDFSKRCEKSKRCGRLSKPCDFSFQCVLS